MGDSTYLHDSERGESYNLHERRPSNLRSIPDNGSSDNLTSPEVSSNNDVTLDVTSTDHLRRRLKQRHVQMIAIAGTLGTGLFLGSAQAIGTAGPLGALIAFALVGSVAYATLCSLGEMTSLAPVSGSFPHFASRWVDPALGFSVGWNYFLTNALYVPAEISGARLLISNRWPASKVNPASYTLAICVAMCATNIFGVVYYAETEFAFSTIKLIMITGLIMVGLLIDLGGLPNQGPIGFKYWKNPGLFVAPGSCSALEPQNPSLDHFQGILSVIIQAAFAYQGMEIVAIAASETVNPRKNITKAIRRVFYRILIFYIMGVFVAGLIVRSDDLNLSSGSHLCRGPGTNWQSPFVIAFNNAGMKWLSSVITAGMLTSAFSAGNSFLFSSSRILYGLAIRNQAPRFLTRSTRKGLPIAAVLCSSAFAFLSLIDVASSAGIVFGYFMQISAVGGLISWFSINLTYIFFFRGLRNQDIPRQKLHYWSPLQPWLSGWGVFWCGLFIIISGFSMFWNFNRTDFVTSYVVVLLFLGLYIFWKIKRKTEVWRPEEMNFTAGIPSHEETEVPEVPPNGFWEHVAAALF